MRRIRNHNRERKALFGSAHSILAENTHTQTQPQPPRNLNPHAPAYTYFPTNTDAADAYAKKEGTSCGYLRPDAAPWIPGERFVFGFSNYIVPNHGIVPRFQGTSL
jgi:hypothetical protein